MKHKVFEKFIKTLNFIEFNLLKFHWIVYSILFCVYILFHKSIELFLNENIVIKFLDQIEYSFFEDFLFSSLLIFLVLIFINRFLRNYKVDIYRIIITATVSSIYIYYRNFSSEWYFVDFKSGIKYFDVIFIIFSFQLLLLLKNLFITLNKTSSSESTPLILDIPLIESKNDNLNREKDAIEIVKRLNATINDKSIAIGIQGQWGLGKSSFFNLLKNELRKDDKNEIIDFNPWRGYKGNALTHDFFEGLSVAVGKYSDLLAHKLRKYGNALLGVDNKIIKLIINSGFDVFQVNSIETQHKEIDRALRMVKKSFYIFIDDVDRLTVEEVIEVIKLIRNTADFYNLKFVLAYDRGYLVNAFKRINDHNYEKYLEKIILYEYSLPPIGSDQINTELFNLIKGYCKEELREQIKKSIEQYKTHILIDLFLNSLRDVKRFANSFIPNYNKYHNEVEFIDYINVEFLKMKYPSINHLIFYEKNKFFKIDSEMLELKYTSTEKGKLEIIDYIEQNKDFYNIDNASKNKLITLLNSLFPVKRQFQRRTVDTKSIQFDKNFSNYFKNETDINLISHTEFEFVIKGSIEKISEMFNIWILQGKRPAIVDKLKKFKIFEKCKTREEFEKIIRIIFLIANKEKTEVDIYLGYPDEDLFDKLYDKKKISKEYYNGDEREFEKYFLSLLERSTSPFRAESDLLSFVSKKMLSKDFILNQEQIERNLLRFFRKFCDSTDEYDNRLWHLYYNCQRGKLNGNLITVEYLEEANEIHKKFIIKNANILKKYLESIIDINVIRGDSYCINPIVVEIFGSYDNLTNSFFHPNYRNENFVKEFIEFKMKLQSQEYKVYVQFNFRYLEVRTL